LPLTGKGVVDILVTEKAVFEKRDGILVLTDVAKNSSLEEVRSETGFELVVADNLRSF
jgi:3-oxoacid CoA-transferase